MSVLTLEAKLERTETSTPWGFRMQGGKDFSSPLTIQKVNAGSLASKCGLQVGDIILKIGNTSTDTLRHKEAQTSIIQSGNHLDLLLQRGGTGGYDKFNAPQISPGSFSAGNPSPQPYAPSALSPSQNFNSAPRPFGSTPSGPRDYSDGGLSHQTQNLSLSGQSSEPVTPSYQNASEKYSERDEPLDPSQHQSKSFKYLQNLMKEGKELNAPLKPEPKSNAFGRTSPSFYNSSSHNSNVAPPPAVHSVKAPPPAVHSVKAPSPTPVGPGNKPGTVKAIVSQKYNNPIGLYSNDNVSTQFEGQTKFLMDKDEAGGSPAAPPVAPPVSHKSSAAPTYQAPHSQPINAPKPWITSPPAHVPNPTPKPFGAAPASSAPPKPSGVGATRGKKGDAAMNAAPLPTGRIPVCSGCNMPIRGPFVTALGMCWCPDHFVCANPQCGVKLLDIGFVEENGFLYCEKDYAVHFAPHCDKCGRAIIGECVNAMNKSFHKDCFLCTHCNKPIGGNQFHLEDGKFYCEADWNVLFRTMCSGCDFPIEPGDSWVEALGKNFHSECFNCTKCQVNLEGQQFVAKAGKPYCKAHAR